MGLWKPSGGGWKPAVGSVTERRLGVALAPGSDAASPDPATEPSRPLRSRRKTKDDEPPDATDIGSRLKFGKGRKAAIILQRSVAMRTTLRNFGKSRPTWGFYRVPYPRLTTASLG